MLTIDVRGKHETNATMVPPHAPEILLADAAVDSKHQVGALAKDDTRTEYRSSGTLVPLHAIEEAAKVSYNFFLIA